MRFARKAIAYEFKRQVELLDRGEQVVQQTRQYLPSQGITRPLREKEEAHDYRYMPDPDLPPCPIDSNWISRVEGMLPALPWELEQLMQETHGLSDYQAEILAREANVAQHFLKHVALMPDAVLYANFMINKGLPYIEDRGIELHQFPVMPEEVANFLGLIHKEKISRTSAYQQLWPVLLEKPGLAVHQLAEELGLFLDQGGHELDEYIEEMIQAFPNKVNAYQNGKKGLIGFFMGQLMKKTQGKINPRKPANWLKPS